MARVHALLVAGEFCDHSLQLEAPVPPRDRPAWLRFFEFPISAPSPVYTFPCFPPTPVTTPQRLTPNPNLASFSQMPLPLTSRRIPFIPKPVYTLPCFPPTPVTTPRNGSPQIQTWLRFPKSLCPSRRSASPSFQSPFTPCLASRPPRSPPPARAHRTSKPGFVFSPRPRSPALLYSYFMLVPELRHGRHHHHHCDPPRACH